MDADGENNEDQVLHEDESETTPSKKDTKYDRQLRLWGVAGQKALMESHVLLVNAGPTGTELLKNLVLPGVGRFTIIDVHKVTERDCQNNFFVSKACMGQPRAKVATELLRELNPDVEGSFKALPPLPLLSSPSSLAPYSLIVATQMDEGSLRLLAAAAAAAAKPLLIARSYGLLGYLRLVLPEHPILDSRVSTDNKAFYNLSVGDTLPEVQALADSLDLESMDSLAYARVPFILLLLKARDKWQAEGRAPFPLTSTAHKQEFAAFIKNMATDHSHENVLEALKRPYLAYTHFSLPAHTHALFAAAADEERGREGDFWLVVRAIKGFVDGEGNGRLPLSGAVPDMASSTALFSQLQSLYRARAAQDFDAVVQRVGDLLQASGRARDVIPLPFIQALCKNAYSLQVLTTRGLEEEYTKPDLAVLREALEDGEMCEAGVEMNPILWYLSLRAVDRFKTVYGHFPGAKEEGEEGKLWEVMQELVKEIFSADADSMEQEEGGQERGKETRVFDPCSIIGEKHAAEMARYGAAELHNIAAIVGGIGAQEAVKILTQQYVPVNNTLLYNGIASVGGVYRL